MQEDQSGAILALFHDPRYLDFEEQLNPASLFRAVGRTFTETWHSAFLGWLLNPKSSHKLGSFPLRRFILLLVKQGAAIAPDMNLKLVLAEGNFENAKATPNEFDTSERSVPTVGRFDVYIEHISWAASSAKVKADYSLSVIVEMKVTAKPNKSQNQKYISYVQQRNSAGNSKILPVFVTREPAADRKTAYLGSEDWASVTFQEVFDNVLAPSLRHSDLSPFGKIALTEYTNALKQRQGGYPLAISDEERAIVRALWDDHEQAIRVLFDVLSDMRSDIVPLPQTDSHKAITISLINLPSGRAKIVQATSTRDLYEKVMKVLDGDGLLSELQLPVTSGKSRYLIAAENKDMHGKPMINPAKFQADKRIYYMEANRSRPDGLSALDQLLKLLGVSRQ